MPPFTEYALSIWLRMSVLGGIVLHHWVQPCFQSGNASGVTSFSIKVKNSRRWLLTTLGWNLLCLLSKKGKASAGWDDILNSLSVCKKLCFRATKKLMDSEITGFIQCIKICIHIHRSFSQPCSLHIHLLMLCCGTFPMWNIRVGVSHCPSLFYSTLALRGSVSMSHTSSPFTTLKFSLSATTVALCCGVCCDKGSSVKVRTMHMRVIIWNMSTKFSGL